MHNKNRKARLHGAMALVASATAELQRLRPHSRCAANAATRATTHKDFPDLRWSLKPSSGGGLTAGLDGRCEKSKFVPLVVKSALVLRRSRYS
jgi:hypothetical protein